MTQDEATRRSRNQALVLVLLVLGLAISLFALVHPWYDLTHDGSTYLLTARALADGEGYRYLGDTFRIRPPGFSALVALFDPDGENFAILNMLVSIFGVGGAALLYLHQRSRVGALLALLTSLAVWLNPGYRRLCTQVMSDVPGLALVLTCLTVERWASRHPSWKRELVLGVAIGLSCYVRSLAILLVPAIALARAFEPADGKRRAAGWSRFALERVALFALLAWLVVLPWSIARGRAVPPPPADQTLNYTLSTAMWHEDPGDPASRRYGAGEILARVPARLGEVALAVGSRLQHRIPGSPAPPPEAALAWGIVALGLGAAWVVVLVRRRAAAEWFVAGVLGVVALYFVFTERLALPLFVFALAAAVEVLRDLVGRLAGPRAGTLVPAAALLALIAVDFDPRPAWPEVRERHHAFAELAAAVESHLAPDARLAAGQGFHYGVFLHRPVYSLMHAARRGGTDAVERLIDKYAIDTVVLSPLVPPDLALVPYFEERYGRGTPAGPARLWQVRSEPARPDLFLISSDTLRADHLSGSGYARATSPALDAFARRAWEFTDAVTVIPKTGPSFATVFTGRHPQVHGVRSNFDALPPALPVLAERLREVGYETVAFVGNPVLRREIGFARGFERYDVIDGKHGEGVRAVQERFLDWARERDWQDAPPAFVWIHYMDPHGPYTPPAELERPFLEDGLARSAARLPLEPATPASGNANKVLGAIPAYQQRDGEERAAVYVARYDAEIRYMDDALGELIAFLEQRGLFEPSAVVFTSDHGESLGENDEWFEHGWFAGEATLRVPLIVKPPGAAAARSVGAQVSNLDLLPTILALAGSLDDPAATGVNLLAPLDERAPLLIESSDRYPDKFHGLRTGGWKYLVRAADGAEQLFDLRRDPGEAHNLAGEEHPQLAPLREACAQALRQARAAAVPAAGRPVDDPATLERLRELGYVHE